MNELAIIVLTIFGIFYAIIVYYRTISPTWLSVVLGVGGTLAGLYLWLPDWRPLAAFILTGGPMILFQILKAHQFEEEAGKARLKTGELGNLDGTDQEEATTIPRYPEH